MRGKKIFAIVSVFSMLLLAIVGLTNVAEANSDLGYNGYARGTSTIYDHKCRWDFVGKNRWNLSIAHLTAEE
jgi:hypothetical protein